MAPVKWVSVTLDAARIGGSLEVPRFYEMISHRFCYEEVSIGSSPENFLKPQEFSATSLLQEDRYTLFRNSN